VATIYDMPTTLNPNRFGAIYESTGVTIGIAGDSNRALSQGFEIRGLIPHNQPAGHLVKICPHFARK
jgi:hypothetical protein